MAMNSQPIEQEPTLRQPAPPPVGGNNPKLSRTAKWIIGVAMFLLMLICIGYYVLFHTAVPARLLVGLINKDPNIQIEGIEGSIKSGFTVATMRFKDDKGNVNELDDVRLKYRQEDDQFVITEVHVGRGVFYVDRSGGMKVDYSGEDHDEYSGGESVNLLVESISINDITVIDVGSRETFKLEGFKVANLKLGETFSMGTAMIRSSGLDLTIRPQDGARISDRFDVSALAKPELHKNVLVPIHLEGEMKMGVDGPVDADLRAFDGKLTIRIEGEELRLSMREFNAGDYFDNALPIEKLEMDIVAKEESGTIKGSFVLGQGSFTLDQALEDAELADVTPIVATCQLGDTTYKLEISQDDFNQGSFSGLELKTVPEMDPREALASLMVGKPYEELAADEQTEVGKLVGQLSGAEDEP